MHNCPWKGHFGCVCDAEMFKPAGFAEVPFVGRNTETTTQRAEMDPVLSLGRVNRPGQIQ